MEPVVATSFIPKRPISGEPDSAPHRGATVGILSFVTVIIVIGTGLAFAGVYFYQQSLNTQKAALQATITKAQDGLGSNFVADMKRLSGRINGVKSLLQGHVVVSPIFAALQATTLQSIQYKDFSYQFATDSGTNAKLVQVHIDGVANNYAALALQSDAYAKSPIIRNPVFSDLVVDEKTQHVGFKLLFTVNPSDLSYQTFVKTLTQ